jgi:hypothetical protein
MSLSGGIPLLYSRAEFLMNLMMDEPCLAAAGDGIIEQPRARPKMVRRCSMPKSLAKALFHLAEITQDTRFPWTTTQFIKPTARTNGQNCQWFFIFIF